MKYFYTIKRILKSILYSLPKSILIWIILFLLLILFSGNSSNAYTNTNNPITVEDPENVIIYESLNIGGRAFDTGINIDSEVEMSFGLDATILFDKNWINIFNVPDSLVLQSRLKVNEGVAVETDYLVMGRSAGYKTSIISGSRNQYYYSFGSENALFVNGVEYQRYSNIEMTSSSNLFLNNNGTGTVYRSTYYLIHSIYFENATDGTDLFYFHPCSYNGINGLYDSKNNTFTNFNVPVLNPTGQTGSDLYENGTGGDEGETENPTNPDYTDSIQGVQDSVDKLQETQEETNEFLKDETVNDSDFELPSVEIEDPTSNFFDVIFQGVYDAVISDESSPIHIDVMGIQPTINASDFNFLEDERFSVLRFILSTSWVVSIGLLILKDLRSIIEDIKNGNIESVASKGDIKANIV